MSKKYYFDAIQDLCPGYGVMLEDFDLDRITWLDAVPPTSPPSKDAIIAKAAELATVNHWKEFREIRNQKLSETDYFGMTDVVMSNEMAAYRQALRDLPANTEDPTNPVWPTKPQ